MDNISSAVWNFLSTRQALGIFLVVILAIIGVLIANVLIALHIVRNEADSEDPDNENADKRGGAKNATRFHMLNRIDEEFLTYTEPNYDDSLTLEQLCVRFRNFSASQLHLYYRIEDVRRFFAGLGVSKLMILQGMSGTGKTSLAYAMGQFWQNDSVVVPVQPMWMVRR